MNQNKFLEVKYCPLSYANLKIKLKIELFGKYISKLYFTEY